MTKLETIHARFPERVHYACDYCGFRFWALLRLPKDEKHFCSTCGGGRSVVEYSSRYRGAVEQHNIAYHGGQFSRGEW